MTPKHDAEARYRQRLKVERLERFAVAAPDDRIKIMAEILREMLDESAYYAQYS